MSAPGCVIFLIVCILVIEAIKIEFKPMLEFKTFAGVGYRGWEEGEGKKIGGRREKGEGRGRQGEGGRVEIDTLCTLSHSYLNVIWKV